MKQVTTLVSALFLATNVFAGSNVTGKIAFKGTPPKATKIKMNADQNCVAANPTDVFSESVVVNGNNTLKNVFIYVKTGLEGKTFPTPTKPVVLDQHGCKYIPHVMGAMVNQPFEIRNSDATLHNIHAMPKKSAQFNVGMPKKDMITTKKFDKPEVAVRVKCDVHPWMSAYVGVTNHPYFAVSDDKGTFEIKDLPAGKYTFEAWHEKLGTQTQEVTVADGKPTNLEFTFDGSAVAAAQN